MKIVLVTSPLEKSILYKEWDLSDVVSVSPPFGLMLLASVVRNHGHEPIIIDAFAYGLNVEETIVRIQSEDPDILGISSFTSGFPSSANLASEMKKLNPELFIILGGPHVTAVPFDTMEKYHQFDMAVVGEGEITLPILLDEFNNGKDFNKINGILFRQDGKLIQNPMQDWIIDLDILPFPAWDLLPIHKNPYQFSVMGAKKEISTSLLTSRGCPGKCSFCFTSGVGRKIRGYSAPYVIKMFEHLIENYGIREFLIYDDTFVTLRKRLFEICEGIKEKGWDISWTCEARVDQVNPEILAAMRSAGCWQIDYGIESGSPQILKLMNKHVTLDQVKRAIHWTKEAGILARGNFILGYIGETKETLRQTIDFALSLELDSMQQTFLTPYPGTVVYQIADNYGDFDRSWEKMNLLTINFIPEGLTRSDLVNASRELFLRFYLRPKVALKLLKILLKSSPTKRLYKMIIAFIKTIARRSSNGDKHYSENKTL